MNELKYNNVIDIIKAMILERSYKTIYLIFMTAKHLKFFNMVNATEGTVSR